MAYSKDEIKSGILIFVSLTLLLVLTFIVGKIARGPSVEYRVRFGYVNGLAKDAPVYFAGREAGRVIAIEILRGVERPVLVTVQIPRQIDLREDTQAFIDTLGLMGEKFVEITPGTVSAPVLKPGAEITGTDPIPMYLLVQKANLLADRMDEMTLSLNPMLKRFNELTEGQDETIAKIIANMEETSANLRDMTYNLKHHPWRLVRKG